MAGSKLVGLGAVLALCGLAVVGTPAVAGGALALGIHDQAARASQEPCRGIGTPVPLVSVTDVEGGKDYTYGEGLRAVHVMVPPAGFDPFTASDHDLEVFDYPPRPKNQDDVAEWREAVTTPRASPSPPCVTDSTAGVVDTTRWSGYVAHKSHRKFKGVRGSVHVPTLKNWYKPGCTAASLVSWVGIGGESSSLIQMGVGYLLGTPTLPVEWYEYFDGSYDTKITVIPESIVPSVGDKVKFDLRRNTSTSFTVFDAYDMTQDIHSVYDKHIPISFWDGSTAEWIDERTASGGTITELLPFEPIVWRVARVQTVNGKWHTLGSRTKERDRMVASLTTGGKLAEPKSPLINPKKFKDKFYHCS